MSQKQLGKRLRQARLKASLTQTQLATKLQLAAATISAYETGRLTPDRELIVHWATVTHQPIHLLTGQQNAAALELISELKTKLTQLEQLVTNLNGDY